LPSSEAPSITSSLNAPWVILLTTLAGDCLSSSTNSEKRTFSPVVAPAGASASSLSMHGNSLKTVHVFLFYWLEVVGLRFEVKTLPTLYMPMTGQCKMAMKIIYYHHPLKRH
jgi:hypothetical protein